MTAPPDTLGPPPRTSPPRTPFGITGNLTIPNSARDITAPRQPRAPGGTLSLPPAITIGGQTAAVPFAGLVSPGLFPFNVVVPNSLTAGDQKITARYTGAATQPDPLLSVNR